MAVWAGKHFQQEAAFLALANMQTTQLSSGCCCCHHLSVQEEHNWSQTSLCVRALSNVGEPGAVAEVVQALGMVDAVLRPPCVTLAAANIKSPGGTSLCM